MSNYTTITKINNLNGKVYHSKFLSGITIVISIKCPNLDSYILSQLKCKICEEDKGVLYKNTELTVLFYAMYSDIYSKLILPGSIKSTGIMNINCHYYNKYFNIVFTICKNTGSAAKKIINEAFKYMKPDKLRKSYDMILKSIGIKYKLNEFNWCLNQLNSCLREDIYIFIIGKINLGKTDSLRVNKLKTILESTNKKFIISKNISSTIKPESLKNSSYISLIENLTDNSILISGINGFYLQKYISFLTKNAIYTEIINNRLMICPTRYDWVINNLKKKDVIIKYVKQKYGKTKDGLTAIVLKSAADSCTIDAKALFSISSKILKLSNISDGILENIK